MNIKLLLDVDVFDGFMESFGERVSKKDVAEAIADRLTLNEIGSADFRMIKEVKGKLVVYGEPF